MKVFHGLWFELLNIASQSFKRLIKDNAVESSTEKVTCAEEFNQLSDKVTEIIFPEDSCDDITEVDFSRFKHLQRLEFNNRCLRNCTSFTIDGCGMLSCLVVGEDCFTNVDWKNMKNSDLTELGETGHSFTVKNCLLLNKIVIGKGSFVDYTNVVIQSNASKSEW